MNTIKGIDCTFISPTFPNNYDKNDPLQRQIANKLEYLFTIKYRGTLQDILDTLQSEINSIHYSIQYTALGKGSSTFGGHSNGHEYGSQLTLLK